MVQNSTSAYGPYEVRWVRIAEIHSPSATCLMHAPTLITAKIAATRLPASAVQRISVLPKVCCFCELFPGCYRRHPFRVAKKLTIPADAGHLYHVASMTHESRWMAGCLHSVNVVCVNYLSRSCMPRPTIWRNSLVTSHHHITWRKRKQASKASVSEK